MEIWKKIKYANLYEVSNYGNIRKIGTIKNLQGSTTGNRNGVARYKSHGIVANNGKRTFNLTHRIVAMHFIPTNDVTLVVNHKDENTFNNAADNLEWISNKENCRYSRNVEINQLDLNGVLIKKWNSLYEIKDNGFNISRISMCLNKRKTEGKYLVKTACKYKWEYV